MTVTHAIYSAGPEDAGQLTELALRSKAHWGYSKAFIDSCRGELTVTSGDIESDEIDYLLAKSGATILGFYALNKIKDLEYELEALFVEPAYIGTGLGRSLMAHATNTARLAGGRKMVIQGDPHATDFYLTMGARLIGERDSGSVAGRRLPLFVIDLIAKDQA